MVELVEDHLVVGLEPGDFHGPASSPSPSSSLLLPHGLPPPMWAYNHQAQHCGFKPGNKVLLPVPTASWKLQVSGTLSGPLHHCEESASHESSPTASR